MEQETPNRSTMKNEAWEWIKALLIALILVFVIRWFLFAPFIVEGPSMQPNFHTGERLIVNKLVYNIRDPKRGEVIVFHATSEKDYIKRVIALPGETIRVVGDQVFVNGQIIPQPYIQEVIDEAAQKGTTYNNRGFEEQLVPEGKIFVMGDNRPESEDSRRIGFISYDQVVGRADIIFWPLPKVKLIH